MMDIIKNGYRKIYDFSGRFFDLPLISMHFMLTLNAWRMTLMNYVYWIGMGIGILLFRIFLFIEFSSQYFNSMHIAVLTFFLISTIINLFFMAWHIIFFRASVCIKDGVYVARYLPQSMIILLPAGCALSIAFTALLVSISAYGSLSIFYSFLFFLGANTLALINIFILLFFLDTRTLPMSFTKEVQGLVHFVSRILISIIAGSIAFVWFIYPLMWIISNFAVFVLWHKIIQWCFTITLWENIFFWLLALVFYGIVISVAVTIYIRYAYRAFENMQQYMQCVMYKKDESDFASS